MISFKKTYFLKINSAREIGAARWIWGTAVSRGRNNETKKGGRFRRATLASLQRVKGMSTTGRGALERNSHFRLPHPSLGWFVCVLIGVLTKTPSFLFAASPAVFQCVYKRAHFQGGVGWIWGEPVSRD